MQFTAGIIFSQLICYKIYLLSVIHMRDYDTSIANAL